MLKMLLKFCRILRSLTMNVLNALICIYLFGVLIPATVHAMQAPPVQAVLPATESLLQSWPLGIYVLELKSSAVGSLKNPPVVDVAVIAELRSPMHGLTAQGVLQARWRPWKACRNLPSRK